MTSLRAHCGAWAAAFLAAGMLLACTPCRADLIASAPLPPAPAGGVQQRLVDCGLDAREAAARVEQLQPQDVATLQANPAQLQLAGDLGAGVLLIAAGVVIFVFLWLVGTEKIDL